MLDNQKPHVLITDQNDNGQNGQQDNEFNFFHGYLFCEKYYVGSNRSGACQPVPASRSNRKYLYNNINFSGNHQPFFISSDKNVLLRYPVSGQAREGRISGGH